MKEFVKGVAAQLTDHPEDISVSEIQGKATVILELRCNAKDVGRVIGRNGKTIGAIRALLRAIVARRKQRAILEVVG